MVSAKGPGGSNPGGSASSEIPPITAKYVLSDQFREVLVDGAWGGPTAGGMVQMSIYTTRMPLPALTEYPVARDSDGRLRMGGERTLEREAEALMVRVVQANIMMTPKAALQVADWLREQAERALEMTRPLKGQEEEGT